MSYKLSTPIAVDDIRYSAYVQIPMACRNPSGMGGLEIMNMRLSNEETPIKKEPEDNDSSTLDTCEQVEDLGDLLSREPIDSPAPEGEKEDGPVLAAPLGEADRTELPAQELTPIHNDRTQDRGNDISFDIPLISVQYV